jgi:hypothetical protein
MAAKIPARAFFAAALLASAPVLAVEPGAPDAPKTTFSITGYYYAMRRQPDFGVGIAALDHGPLHLEARYNYEARNATSVFGGWKFSGGDTISYSVTPILGGLFGSVRGVIPGVEASVAYRAFDAYIEAEYVIDLNQRSASYYYGWSELGWKPVEWLRVGLAGQRTKTLDNGRDFQRGVFAQATAGKATLSFYAFNPESGSRYGIIALNAQF